jgi:hypothetical protein
MKETGKIRQSTIRRKGSLERSRRLRKELRTEGRYETTRKVKKRGRRGIDR